MASIGQWPVLVAETKTGHKGQFYEGPDAERSGITGRLRNRDQSLLWVLIIHCTPKRSLRAP